MSGDRFAMVSEWMTNGNINQFIMACQDANRFELVSSHVSRNPIDVENLWFPQLADVTKGLAHMHSRGMVHGDLKGVRLRQHGSLTF